MMYEAGLVLEGGGMRGVYTAGILDYFLEKDLYFSKCYGVSAGVCNLINFMSRQKGRQYRVSTEYLKDKNYCSISSLLKTGDLFNEKMCYHTIPEKLDIFDNETFKKYPGEGYAVVSNVVTGKAAYLPIKDMDTDIDYIRASASLPLVSRMVEINGNFYLDGGMVDSIPIRKSVKDGNEKHIVILTRPMDYRKKPASNMAIINAMYHKYPGLVYDMKTRHKRYNWSLDYIEKLELQGKVFVFRPDKLVNIDRLEKDKKKLTVMYLQGYHDAAINYPLMKKFLEE